MIQITARIDNQLAAMSGKQLPFVTSLAINRTAMGARDAVRENLPKRFKLRNNWTMGGIQARTGNKTNLMATVLAPDYMAIQETGGERTPTASKLLAAPSTENKGTGIIPRGKRPKALISSGKAFIRDMGNGEAGVFQRMGGKKRSKLRLMYWLSGEQQYEERFGFVDDVTEHVREKFSAHFASALATATKQGV